MRREAGRGVIIVDAANVIGSRPNGWWRDRPGALRRLVEALPDGLADIGEVIVVAEGEARAGIPEQVPEGVEVVAARGSGDDAIVELVREIEGPIMVVTSDRRLRERVEALGATTVGARWLWERIEAAKPRSRRWPRWDRFIPGRRVRPRRRARGR